MQQLLLALTRSKDRQRIWLEHRHAIVRIGIVFGIILVFLLILIRSTSGPGGGGVVSYNNTPVLLSSHETILLPRNTDTTSPSPASSSSSPTLTLDADEDRTSIDALVTRARVRRDETKAEEVRQQAAAAAEGEEEEEQPKGEEGGERIQAEEDTTVKTPMTTPIDSSESSAEENESVTPPTTDTTTTANDDVSKKTIQTSNMIELEQQKNQPTDSIEQPSTPTSTITLLTPTPTVTPLTPTPTVTQLTPTPTVTQLTPTTTVTQLTPIEASSNDPIDTSNPFGSFARSRISRITRVQDVPDVPSSPSPSPPPPPTLASSTTPTSSSPSPPPTNENRLTFTIQRGQGRIKPKNANGIVMSTEAAAALAKSSSSEADAASSNVLDELEQKAQDAWLQTNYTAKAQQIEHRSGIINSEGMFESSLFSPDHNDGEQRNLTIVWDFGACGCTGWCMEATNMVLSIAPYVKRLAIIAGKNCFCPGYAQTDLDLLESLRKQPVSDFEQIDIWISHKPPQRYPSFPYRGLVTVERPPLVVIGRSMSEVHRIPQRWSESIRRSVDELWLPSQHSLQSFQEGSGVGGGIDLLKYIHLIPEPIDEVLYDPFSVEPLKWSSKPRFNFLSIFKLEERKGWKNLLRAWMEEFDDTEDVGLVIHTYQFGFGQPYNLKQIRSKLENYVRSLKFEDRDLKKRPLPWSRVKIFTGETPMDQMPRLYKACQAFVLPTHGEGWGLPLAEAMAMGLPTIATNWGGQTEFMNSGNSYLLPVERFIDAEGTDFEPGSKWAEPSHMALRQSMRHVVDHPSHTISIAARGRMEIVEKYNLHAVGELILQRFDQLMPLVNERRQMVKDGRKIRRGSHLSSSSSVSNDPTPTSSSPSSTDSEGPSNFQTLAHDPSTNFGHLARRGSDTLEERRQIAQRQERERLELMIRLSELGAFKDEEKHAETISKDQHVTTTKTTTTTPSPPAPSIADVPSKSHDSWPDGDPFLPFPGDEPKSTSTTTTTTPTPTPIVEEFIPESEAAAIAAAAATPTVTTLTPRSDPHYHHHHQQQQQPQSHQVHSSHKPITTATLTTPPVDTANEQEKESSQQPSETVIESPSTNDATPLPAVAPSEDPSDVVDDSTPDSDSAPSTRRSVDQPDAPEAEDGGATVVAAGAVNSDAPVVGGGGGVDILEGSIDVNDAAPPTTNIDVNTNTINNVNNDQTIIDEDATRTETEKSQPTSSSSNDDEKERESDAQSEVLNTESQLDVPSTPTPPSRPSVTTDYESSLQVDPESRPPRSSLDVRPSHTPAAAPAPPQPLRRRVFVPRPTKRPPLAHTRNYRPTTPTTTPTTPVSTPTTTRETPVHPSPKRPRPINRARSGYRHAPLPGPSDENDEVEPVLVPSTHPVADNVPTAGGGAPSATDSDDDDIIFDSRLPTTMTRHGVVERSPILQEDPFNVVGRFRKHDTKHQRTTRMKSASATIASSASSTSDTIEVEVDENDDSPIDSAAAVADEESGIALDVANSIAARYAKKARQARALKKAQQQKRQHHRSSNQHEEEMTTRRRKRHHTPTQHRYD